MKDVYQKLFDTALHGLRVQDAPSTKWNDEDGAGSCVYRGVNGRKCALGHLIKDEYYDPVLEGYSALNAWVMGAVVQSMELDSPYDDWKFDLGMFLRDIQNTMHDFINERLLIEDPSNPVKFWHEELEARAEMFASKYGLEYGR